jgi:hypothetical protein
MRVQVKKGLMGRYTLGYDCPRCKTGLTSQLEDACKSDACPDCGATFVVPGSETRDKIHTYQATARQELDKERKVKQQVRREKFATMTAGQKAGYWTLTILGLVFVTLTPFTILDEPHRWRAVPFAMLFGATLLPQLWDWIAARSAVVQQNAKACRILSPIAPLLLLAAFDSDRSYPTSPRGRAANQALSTNQVLITREEYGKAWPFTVDEGILIGDSSRGLPAVSFAVGSTTYGINGVASSDPSNAEVEAIWAKNPDISGARINIGPIIDRGLSLAKGFDEPYVPPIPPPQPANINAPPLRCDSFQVNARFVGDESMDSRQVQVSVNTDLPDETEVMVRIDRSWVNTVEGETYAEDYFSEKSTIGQWRNPRTVDLHYSQFVAGLDRAKQIHASIGEPISVGSIDDAIEVSFIVPVGQSDARFAPQNRNLEGSAVKVSYGVMRNVEGKVRLRWPISGR